MAALLFCEPTELYNILNQVTKLSRLTEANYLCLLDVRSKREYDESHIITALRVKKAYTRKCPLVHMSPPPILHKEKTFIVLLRGDQYLVPESVDLECVRYCVVYDSNTSNMDLRLRVCDDDEDSKDKDGEEKKPAENRLLELLPGPAVVCGKILTNLTRQPVYILRGGYEYFSGQYHFFRTQKIFWMPQELDAFQPYPIEILPGKVFLGKLSQACDPKIHKDLKIKAHVNLSMESTPFFIDDQERLLHVKIEDSSDSSIFPFLRHICHFMEVHLRLHSTVLVFSTRGISRSSAAIVAFLMHRNTETLKRSWMYVKKCKDSMRPNRGLVAQLLEWEKIIVGDCLTDISDPMF